MRHLALLLGALLLAACGSTEEAPPRERRTETTLPSAPSSEGERAAPEGPHLPARPTLADVVGLAGFTPRLRAAREATNRERGEKTQTDLIPNPMLMVKAGRVDVNDAGGGPGLYRVTLSERFETAGKRGLRTGIADERIRQMSASALEESFRVAQDAARLQQRALTTEDLAAAHREALEAARALVELEEVRVAAGRRPESVLPPLRAEVGRRRIRLAEVEETRRTALRALEGVLAVPPETFLGVSGEPLVDVDLPEATTDEVHETIATANPELLTRLAEVRRARAEIEHAQALAWPDVTVGLEYENLQPPVDLHALSLILEVPLPIADRNQGSVEAHRAHERQARAQVAEARARLLAAYASTLESIRVRKETLATYREEIVPAREKDLELALRAEAGGRVDRRRALEARLALAGSRAEAAALAESIASLHLDALAILGRDPGTWGE